MIVITGDSWGVGEWSKTYQLSGPGFTNYLALSSEVVNLSAGNSSNTDSLTRLLAFLNRLDPKFDFNFDTFYWIVTDPIRCVESTICQVSDSLKGTTVKALTDSLAQANTLATEYNIKLKLIGGLCDLNNVDLSTFSNLEIAVPSWGRLLTDDYNTSIYGDIPRWPDLGIKIKELRPDLLDEWNDIATEVNNKLKSWDKMKDTFFTTCGYHPDRNGHLTLHNYLYPEFKSKAS